MNDAENWYGQDAATFGDRVAAAREQAGMSQKDLARRLGIRLDTLRKWENDVSEPRANRLSMMAGLLNVSMMWLINGEGAGMDEPTEEADLTNFARDVMLELRDVRSDMLKRAEQIGRLEKKLRMALQEQKGG